MVQENPLVSVCVITYNSSPFVVETLDSIVSQSYPNIELIVSDDCSSDDTINIVRQWISQNSKRFNNVIVIESSKNTGVSSNCNRGIKACNGQWIKTIAGDDLLKYDCIEKNLKFIQAKSNIRILYSISEVFESETKRVIGTRPSKNIKLETNAESQLQRLILKDFVNPTTLFYEKSLIEEVGFFDERYPFMEDYPMWYKILKAGFAIFYMNEVTVEYRVSGNSLSTSKKLGRTNKKWLTSSYAFYNDNIRKELRSRKKYLCIFFKDMDYILKQRICDSSSIFTFYMYKIINSIINRIYTKIYL